MKKAEIPEFTLDADKRVIATFSDGKCARNATDLLLLAILRELEAARKRKD